MSRLVAVTVLALAILGALSAAVASAVRPVDAGAGLVAGAPIGPSLPAGIVPARPVAPAVAGIAPPVPPSRALGRPNRGRLVRGVLLAAEGPDHTTWDPIDHVAPNRDWRRVGTDRLVATILGVAADYRRRNPGAPRVVVGDVSLPQGGRFGPEYGGLGHASHQNGLDVDVAYPRADGREIGITRVGQIDRPRAQALVDAFVRAGAQYVFVGPRTRLRGPAGVVQPLVHHDDHLHVRIPAAG